MRFILFCFLLINLLKAQNCTTCNININNSETASYTVTQGQTLCIDSTGSFLGKLVMDGGTLCNKGFFNPTELIVLSGAVINHANITLGNSLTLPSNSSLSILEGSVINIAGEFINNGSSITNLGFINVSGNISNNSGTFTNDNVVSCSQIIIGTIINNAVVNTN